MPVFSITPQFKSIIRKKKILMKNTFEIKNNIEIFQASIKTQIIKYIIYFYFDQFRFILQTNRCDNSLISAKNNIAFIELS